MRNGADGAEGWIMTNRMRPVVAGRTGFTLIELLIVVAIISILASIAVPNFLEAQIRAKCARAQAEMRTIEFGLEAYVIDNNVYPVARDMSNPDPTKHANFDRPLSRRLLPITTPIPYLGALPRDIFPAMSGWNGKSTSATLRLSSFDTYDYFDAQSDYDEDMNKLDLKPPQYDQCTDSTRGCGWRLASCGPDLWGSFGIVWGPRLSTVTGGKEGFDYDPTNGSISNGDIVRTGGSRVRPWDADLTHQYGSKMAP
jgi:prepilin-type N-terminal cleavage/methylation domain-containing protein